MSSVESTPVVPPSRVPVVRFGKDHWSLLAYIECICVDGTGAIGVIAKERLRCNEKRHPLLAVNRAAVSWQPTWSSRLTGYFDFAERADVDKAVAAGLMVRDHDDWDCLDDLDAAGFVETLNLVNGAVRMTPVGQFTSALLRDFKAKGGQFAQFKLPSDVPATAEPF